MQVKCNLAIRQIKSINCGSRIKHRAALKERILEGDKLFGRQCTLHDTIQSCLKIRWKLDYSDGCTTLNLLKIIELYT